MNISYVSCKDSNVLAFLIAQFTFLEAHLVMGMWLLCHVGAVRWWEIEKLLVFPSFGFIVFLLGSSATSDSWLVF